MKTFETEKKNEPSKKNGAYANDAQRVTPAAASGGENPLETFLLKQASPPSPPRPPQPGHTTEDWLAILDEFDRQKENPTLFDSMEADPAWLTMKDVRLQAGAAPQTSASAEGGVLSVPDGVLPLVRDLQMAIGYLAQNVSDVWAGRLDRDARSSVAGRVTATVQVVGAALAEGMTALCASASLQQTDTALLQKQEQSEGLAVLAGDVLNLLGPADVIRLVDAGGGPTDALLAGDPSPEALKARLTVVLGWQLLATAEATPALKTDLAALTDRRVKDYYAARHASLGESVAKLQHARDKSARLREAISANVTPGLDDHVLRWTLHLGKTPGGIARRAKMRDLSAPLMRALKQCEDTLDRAIGGITLARAGALAILTRLTGEKIADSTLANYWRKKLTGLGHAVAAVSPHIPLPFGPSDPPASPLRDHMTPEKSSTLSTLLLPLDNAARQVKSLSAPLLSETEKLERVMKRESATAVDAGRLQREGLLNIQLPGLQGPALAQRVFGTVLEGALDRERGAVRLDDKLQAAQDSVAELIGSLITLLPHLLGQLNEPLRQRATSLFDVFSGDRLAANLINDIVKMGTAFRADLTTFQTAATAYRDATARGKPPGHTPEAVAALLKAARKITGRAREAIVDMDACAVRYLGRWFGYNGHERKLVGGLKALVLERGGDTPEKARPILDDLTTRLSDPERTVLRRKHDPKNVLLLTALAQEMQDEHNGISQRLPASMEEIMAQTPGMMDAIYGKAITKTLSTIITTGASALMGNDVLEKMVENALNPLLRLQRPTNAFMGIQMVASYKAMKSIDKARMPRQRAPDYQRNKMLNRQAVNVALALTKLIPGTFLLPVSLPVALYAAVTRPELFVKKIANALPMNVTSTVAFENARGAMSGLRAYREVVQNGKPELAGLLQALQNGDITQEELLAALEALEAGEATAQPAEAQEDETQEDEVQGFEAQGDRLLRRGKRSTGGTAGKPEKVQRFYTLSRRQFREWLHMTTLGSKDARYALTRRGPNGTVVMYMGLEELMVEFDPATDEVTAQIGGQDWAIDALNRYLLRTQQDVDTENVQLGIEETQQLYQTGYPGEMAMNQRIHDLIQRHIDRLTNGGMINGVKITPDTLLDVTVSVSTPGSDLSFPVTMKFSIWKIATGQHIRETSMGQRFKVHPPKELESLFAEGPLDFIAYPYPITKMIHDDFEKLKAQLATDESKAARTELHRRMIMGSLARALEKEPEGSEAYRAIDDVLAGRKQAFTMKFYHAKMAGVIAIPLEGKDRYLIVNTFNAFTPGSKICMTVDMHAPDNAGKSAEVFEWLKPGIPPRDLAKHTDPVAGRAPERMGWVGSSVQRPGGIPIIRKTYSDLRGDENQLHGISTIPYTFHSIDFGPMGKNLAGKVANDEFEAACEDFDYITYSPGEFYSQEAISLGQELLQYAPFGVMAIPSKIGAAAASLAISVAGFALDYAEAQLEEDPDERQQKVFMAMVSNGLSSALGDVNDAATLLKGVRHVRRLKTRIRGYTKGSVTTSAQGGAKPARAQVPRNAGAGKRPTKAQPAEATAPGRATRPGAVPPSTGRKAADAEYDRLQDEMKTHYGEEAYSHLANRMPSRQGLNAGSGAEGLKPNNMGVTSMAEINQKIAYTGNVKGEGPRTGRNDPNRQFKALTDVGNRLEAAGPLSPAEQLTHLAALEKSLSGTLFARHRLRNIADGPVVYGNPAVLVMDPKQAAVLLDYLAEVRGRMRTLGGKNVPAFTDLKLLRNRAHHFSVEVAIPSRGTRTGAEAETPKHGTRTGAKAETPERGGRIDAGPARPPASFADMKDHEKIAYLTDYGMALPEAKALAAQVGDAAVRQSIRSTLQSKYTGHSKQNFTWGSEALEKAHIERRLRAEGDRLKGVSRTMDNALTEHVPHRGPGNDAEATQKGATWIVGSSQTLQARSDAEVAEAVTETAKILDEFKNMDVTDYAQVERLHDRLYRINPGEQARIFRTVEVPHFTSSFVGRAYFRKFLANVRAQGIPDRQGALVYEGLLRAHPFPDANGRTARALYVITEMRNKRFEVPKPVVIDGATAAPPRPGAADRAPLPAPAVQDAGAPLQQRTGARTKGPGSGAPGPAPAPVPVPPTGTHVIGNTVYVDGRPKANHDQLSDSVIRISEAGATRGSDTAVFTAHGNYFDSSTMVKPPADVELSFMAPHDMYLADPTVPFILNHPDKYNAFVNIRGEAYEVPKFKRPDLQKEAELTTHEWVTDATTGQDIKVPVSLDNPKVVTGFDSHGIGPRRPDNPQAAPGEDRKEVRNYNYWRYEYDDVGEIATAVKDNAALSRQAGSPVVKQDVIILDKAILEPGHLLHTKSFTLEDLVKMHEQGLLVNSEGKPYKKLVMSHCRNRWTGERYGLYDSQNLTYSYSGSEAVDDAFTKGLRRVGAETYDYYEDTVEFQPDGSTKTTRRFVGTMYAKDPSAQPAGAGTRAPAAQSATPPAGAGSASQAQSATPLAGAGSGGAVGGQVPGADYVKTPITHPQGYEVYAIGRSGTDQHSLYFWDKVSRKLVPYGTGVEKNGKWAKVQLEGGNLFGKGAKKADENRLNESITAIRKDKDSLSEQERQDIGKNIEKLLDEGQNKGEAQSVKDYTHAGSGKVNEALRSGKRSQGLNTFLREFDNLNDYRGMSYRAAYITPAGAKRLKSGIGKKFSDEGVQSASTNAVNANDWGKDGFVTQMKTDDSVPVVFIFDEYVHQKNLSNSQLGDHVAVVPGTPLKLLATKEVDGVLYAYFTIPTKIPRKTYRLYDGVETRFAK